MHDAPSVSYPVGRCVLAAVIAQVVWLAGVLAWLAWVLQAPAGWRQSIGAGLLAATGIAAFVAWRRSATGLLAWDGQGWRWADGSGEADGRVAVALDLQQ